MKMEDMFKLPKTKINVFVAAVNEKVKGEAIKIAQKLRTERINCQTDLMGKNLTKQLEYADSVRIPFVLIVGEKELKEKKFVLKDMMKKSESKLKIEEIIKSVGRNYR
jgi:histidyl-tRNA synthetase